MTLTWVPGHSEVEGSEIADLLAKQDANLHDSYISKIPIPLPIAKLKIQELGERKWTRKWENISTSKTSKILWPEINRKLYLNS